MKVGQPLARGPWPARFPGSRRRSHVALGVVLAAVGLVGVLNASRYPAGLSYDGGANMAYADGIVRGFLPSHSGEFHQPPGFYAVASAADWVLSRLPHSGDPHRAAQALNVALFVASLVLMWLIVSEVWPAEPWRAPLAVCFAAALPAAERAAVMFHPEMLDLFLTTLGVFLTVRLAKRPTLKSAALVGLVFGLAQLVRAFSLAILAAVVVALLLERNWRPVGVLVAVALLVPAPWYIRQAVVYGTPLPFNRPTPKQAIWDRRPVDFYLGLGLPDAIIKPYRPSFVNQAIPTTYNELWGDYFGHWRWNGSVPPPPYTIRDDLTRQSIAGLAPTALALIGWLSLLVLAWRRRTRGLTILALVPLFGLAQYAAFTISYPSVDGDVLKGTYLLATTIGWAAGFAYIVTRLPRGLLLPAAVILCAAAVIDAPFLVFH